MTEDDILEKVRSMNPAPEQALTPAQEARMRHLRARLTHSDLGRTRPTPRKAPVLIAATGVLALVAIVGLGFASSQGGPPAKSVAVSDGTITPADLLHWTNAPSALDPRAPVAINCAETLGRTPGIPAKSPTRILNSDLRGDVGSVIVQQGAYIAYCVGTDGLPVYVLYAEPGFDIPAPGPAGVTLGPAGGRIPPDGYGFAAGTAAKDVMRLVLHEDGHVFTATVQNGWWTAWWPSNDESALMQGTVTVTKSNGTVATYKAEELRAHDK